MKKLGIFAADEMFQIPANLDLLRRDFEVIDVTDWANLDPDTLLAKMRSVEIILTGRKSPRLPEALAQDLGELRYLCHMFGTIRHLASKPLVEAGLIVTNWGDQVAGVAEGAMALLLCMLKQLVTFDRFTKGGEDERIYQMFPCTLKGMDVGLYGFGPIGRHMARMLSPFGAKIAIHDPFATEVPEGIRRCSSLRELFATCQAVSIHCGLNAQTQNSVTGELLDLLPEGGILINTARGAIVDEPALAQRVAAGRILAGLDVIVDEKNWTGSPLARLSGAVLTHHHVGSGKGYPPDRKPTPRLPDHTLENLTAYRQGLPLKHVISAAVYDFKT